MKSSIAHTRFGFVDYQKKNVLNVYVRPKCHLTLFTIYVSIRNDTGERILLAGCLNYNFKYFRKDTTNKTDEGEEVMINRYWLKKKKREFGVYTCIEVS